MAAIFDLSKVTFGSALLNLFGKNFNFVFKRKIVASEIWLQLKRKKLDQRLFARPMAEIVLLSDQLNQLLDQNGQFCCSMF